MSSINYSEKIPNNVNLSEDRTLQRALEQWQPNYLSWWQDMGPDGSQDFDVYLRTAVSVDPQGWAQFGHVKMPDYRWGIFLNPAEKDRKIHFGDHLGEAAWQDVPGEYRANLRRIIVTQGDTEPASVEQQRHLGLTAPSQYDLRNLFQVNVEEGRHLWAMVYLLQTYFGGDGRDEAEAMLERHSGDADNPRILQAFNYPVTNWLDFFCFTAFMDRDGKYQLASLAESSFDPLARTTQFMLAEEAYHLQTGENGVGRIIKRTGELMAQGTDPRSVGAIPLDVIQRYVNFWFTGSMDLFGGEDSTNASESFASGLKGRYRESDGIYKDPKALNANYTLEVPTEDGQIEKRDIPLRRAMNAVLLDAYIADCRRIVDRWNKDLEKLGVSERIALPDHKFHRYQGVYAGFRFNPAGELIDEAAWTHNHTKWLPTQADRDYVNSCMVKVTEPGKFANYIAPPQQGPNNQPIDFEYVKFH